jgi:hypothetical protein
VLHPLPHESRRRLRRITRGRGQTGTVAERKAYKEWLAGAIAPRNIVQLADPARHNLYPVDIDALIEQHELLGMSRDQLVAGLPALRG